MSDYHRSFGFFALKQAMKGTYRNNEEQFWTHLNPALSDLPLGWQTILDRPDSASEFQIAAKQIAVGLTAIGEENDHDPRRNEVAAATALAESKQEDAQVLKAVFETIRRDIEWRIPARDEWRERRALEQEISTRSRAVAWGRLKMRSSGERSAKWR